MEVLPIHDAHWDDERGEMVEGYAVIGYECYGLNGQVLGRGETVADAIEEALKTAWAPPGRPSAA